MGDLLALLEDNFLVGFDDALQLNRWLLYLDLFLGKLNRVLPRTIGSRLVGRGIHLLKHRNILNYYNRLRLFGSSANGIFHRCFPTIVLEDLICDGPPSSVL